ncbi:MAG: Phage minor structural protein, partial [Candidatus Moranbacteria bacterium GW2011_GWD2_37_9]
MPYYVLDFLPLSKIARYVQSLIQKTQKLDSKNVKRLDTNETHIASNKGETVIQGPLILMYDKQGVPVLRLKMGYDAESAAFVNQLMNASGEITYYVDSNGNLVVERGTFKGSITIGTGNDVFKAGNEGIWLGHAEYALAPFRVSKDGTAVATNLTAVGGIIKGGSFRNADETMEVSFSGNEFRIGEVGAS